MNSLTTFWGGIEVQGSPYGQQQSQTEMLANWCTNKTCLLTHLSTTSMFPCYESFPAWIGGIVYCDNSKFRYADIAIAIGEHLSGYPDYLENGWGLLFCQNSTFENNRYNSINFGIYRTFPQLSLVKNCTFNSNFTNNIYIDHQGVGSIFSLEHLRMNTASLKNPIENSTFKKTKYIINSQFVSDYDLRLIGIGSFNGNCKIKNCKFDKVYTGIIKEDFIPILTQSLYEKNLFTGNVVGIYTKGGNNLKVTKNVHYIPQGFISGGLNYFNSGFENYSGYNIISTYNSYRKAASKQKLDNAIVSVDGSTLASKFEYEDIKDEYLGIWAVGNNLGLQMQCNTIQYKNKGGYDVYCQRSTDKLPTLGAAFREAGNTFSRTFISGKEILNNGPNFKYYYSTSPARHNPLYITPTNSVTKISGTINTCNAPYYETVVFPSNECGQISPPGGGGKTNDFSGTLAFVESIEEGGISTEEADDYQLALHDFDIASAELLGYYTYQMSQDSVNRAIYYDSIAEMLESRNSFQHNYYKIALNLEFGDFGSITTLLDAMDDDTTQYIQEFCTYMRIMNDYAASNYSDTWLFSRFTTLKNIADSSAFMNGYAKNIVNYIVRMDTNNAYHGTLLYDFALPPVELYEDVDSLVLDLILYPNPVSNELSVSLTNALPQTRNLTIEIVDLSFNVMYSDTVTLAANSSDGFNIDVSFLNVGYYVIKILENSDIRDHELFYKQ